MQKLYKIILCGLGIFTAAMLLYAGYYWLQGGDPFFILLCLATVLSPFLMTWMIDKSTERDYVKININAVVIAIISLYPFVGIFSPLPQ